MKLQRGPVAGVVAALVVLAGSQLFPGSMPLGVILMGALLGTGTGLMAVGLVLTYRTTRIINFSYGAMGSAGAGVAAGLALGKGWSWVIAGPVGVAVGVAIGALVERFVIRRFATAPRLVLTVATVGLALGDRPGAGTVTVSVPCVAAVASRLSNIGNVRGHPLLKRAGYDDIVGAAIAHELGHVLGLKHGEGLMRPSPGPRSNRTAPEGQPRLQPSGRGEGEREGHDGCASALTPLLPAGDVFSPARDKPLRPGNTPS